MTVCAHCHLWPLHADNEDVYCSWCHEKLVGYEVTLNRDVLVLGNASLSAWLTVRNLGQTELVVDDITSSETWLPKPANVAGHSLPPDSVPLSVQLDVQQGLLEADRTYTATITVTMRDGSASERVTLQVVPAPQVRVEIDDYAVILDDTATNLHSGRVILEKGAVHLTVLEISEPWLTVADDQPWPRLLAGAPGSELRFGLRLNAALLRERLPLSSTAPTAFPVLLTLYGKELEQPVERRLTITCAAPPELHLTGLRGATLHLSGFARRCHDVRVHVENRGGLPLVLNQMHLDEAVSSWLQLAPSQHWPVTLPPGQSRDVLLRLDGTVLATGAYQTTFTLLSNSYTESRLDVPVVIHVEEMKEYDGVVAFDFGTTNSCAVVWDSNGIEARLIPLDLTATVPTTLPSVILYEQLLADERKVYQVGTDAKQLAPLVPESAVRSIKRAIGQRARVPIVFDRDGQRRSYLPEEIARDIIAHIIGQVESHLGKKIVSCVITHPSTFAPSQLNALERAFTAYGVHVDMMLHEPVAAALEYILSPEQTHPASPYTLLVYDFGGGTTDITLLSVEDVRDPGGTREITPNVLGASGRQRFGGDDVTAKVARELCRQFNEWLIRNRTPYRLEADQDAIARLDDRTEQLRARRNYSLMLGLAEETKIRLSDDPDSNPAIRSPILEIVHDGQSMGVQAAGELTRHTLNDLIREDIESTLAIVDRLIQQKANGQPPDVILLSGQSSRLPLVQELFAQRFPPPDRIRWAGQRHHDGATTEEPIKLKECVVKGACQVAWFLTLPGAVAVNPTHMQPMATARIGLMAMNADGQPAFKTVIAEGDPVGVPKSIEGLRLTRQSRLRVLENTAGSSDDLNSPDIEELGIYLLNNHLPPGITNRDLRDARLAMELNEHYEVIMRLYVRNREEPFSFVCERWVKDA